MIEKALPRLLKGDKLIFHSDQGWQYQHKEIQKLLSKNKITQSMSRKGNCLDNSLMENFLGRLKTEMYYGYTFTTVQELISSIEDYIYYYNHERIKIKLKGMSPVEYGNHSFA